MRIERRCGALLALAGAALLSGCASNVRSAVLGAEQTEVVAEQCSRPNPPHYESTWQPAPADILQLEQDLPLLNAQSPAAAAAHVGDALGYYRQYFGIVVHGRRMIYVNAFVEGMYRSTDWKQFAIVVCDGGPGAWGALYDPANRLFSGFAFNGRP
ncbi:hypothetical protein [Nevskia soli]|uniref:hypothetical protein n=1 Tax=Nevskia soli TaxID=418856 RepID=UPI00068DCF7B|nr:hypothetical protein [Nevskia soli]